MAHNRLQMLIRPDVSSFGSGKPGPTMGLGFGGRVRCILSHGIRADIVYEACSQDRAPCPDGAN